MSDWLEDLEKEFAHLMDVENRPSRARFVERLMEIFFGMWLKFDLDRGVRMQLTPFEWEFVEYQGHKDWEIDENFNFEGVTDIELLDTRFPHKQALRAEMYKAEDTTRFRIIFEIGDWREGEREGVTPYLLYDAPLEAARASDAWKEVKNILSPWNEAHIGGNQEPFWDWIKSSYMELPRR